MYFFEKYQSTFKWLFWGLIGFLSYLLLIELPPAPDAFAYKDKVQHIVAFGGVTGIGLLAYTRFSARLAILISVYGALMEIMQGIFTTTREPSFLDWLADNVGIVLAYILVIQGLRWWGARHA